MCVINHATVPEPTNKLCYQKTPDRAGAQLLIRAQAHAWQQAKPVHIMARAMEHRWSVPVSYERTFVRQQCTYECTCIRQEWTSLGTILTRLSNYDCETSATDRCLPLKVFHRNTHKTAHKTNISKKHRFKLDSSATVIFDRRIRTVSGIRAQGHRYAISHHK